VTTTTSTLRSRRLSSNTNYYYTRESHLGCTVFKADTGGTA
jgi:hypothetical protein